jgi:NADH-quinone oxidoreductase subunit I
MGYWQALAAGFGTAWQGLSSTMGHIARASKGKKEQNIREEGYFGADGIVTLNYPEQKLAIPPLGRYKLDVEIDDCIVCDKCARVCPVNCIDIEAIKSPEVWGTTSDGTGKRLYAARFDIDMAKCCFCGLCTTVCPTDCIVMTGEYDFPTLNLEAFNFEFAELTPEEAAQKKADYERFAAEKAAAKKG